MTKVLKLFFGSVLGIFAASSVYAGETFDRIKRGGTLYIGFANEAPYAYRAPNGDIQGVVYDVGKAVFVNRPGFAGGRLV